VRVKVVCITCDLYSKLIPGFCYFLAEGWPERPWPLEIVAGTEQPWFEGLPYAFWYYGRDKLWASNVLAYLRQTDARIVMLLLDDYYLLDPVDNALMVELAAMMRDDESIGYVNLRPWTDDVLDGRQWQEWQRIGSRPLVGEYDKATAEYLLSLQPGMWRTDFLASLLVEGEDHWTVERQGTERARRSGKRMLGVVRPFPAPYLNVTRYGVYRDGSRGILAGRLGEGHEILALLDDMLKERIRGCW
jgi:hypothetical protein